MFVDESDNTLEFCPGGVWVYVDQIADAIGIRRERLRAWVKSPAVDGIDDIVREAILDAASLAIENVWRSGTDLHQGHVQGIDVASMEAHDVTTELGGEEWPSFLDEDVDGRVPVYHDVFGKWSVTLYRQRSAFDAGIEACWVAEATARTDPRHQRSESVFERGCDPQTAADAIFARIMRRDAYDRRNAPEE